MTTPRRLITVVTPCYNEEGNARELYTAVKDIFRALPQYGYEHIFIDNASKDATAAILRELAAADPRGEGDPERAKLRTHPSPVPRAAAGRGDATIGMASDFQDPPELIPRSSSSGRRV